MTLRSRDRRALAILAAAVLITLGVQFWGQAGPAAVTGAADSIPLAERRLARVREIAASVPGQEKALEGIQSQLRAREKGIISAATAAQAQAQMMQTVRKLAAAQAPPIQLRQMDVGAVQPLGAHYGEALISLSMTCRIEQLVNLLADITAQPELIATHEININAGDPKLKTLMVRLTLSGVIPRALAPERKALGVF